MLYQSREIELDKGIFMVSIDLELAWGFNYELLKGSSIAEKYLRIIKERSRKNVKKLLELSERFKVPFMWGIVGHLFLSSCTRDENGLPHPDMSRPALDVNKDWYFNDPCSNIFDEPLWYGTDIIKQILESGIEQEIACHSFSHVDFSKCSKEVALVEVRKCKEVMKDFDIEPKSFIFPKNKIGHLDVLEQEGFRAFRFKPKHRLKYPLRKLSSPVVETLFPIMTNPFIFKNLVGIPSSLLFQSSNKYDTLRLELAAKRGISLSIKNKKIFHITMHDYLETDNLLQSLSKILAYVKRLREQESINVMTMYMFHKLI
jgi:peptidoglycan/xylan/chitin deacetylase (PgdA/CDA1 family)